MKQIIRYITFLMFFTAFNQTVHAQISESDVKAAFVERFTRFVEWPTNAPGEKTKSNFVITVLGENTFGSSLDNLFNELKIKNRPVSVKYTQNHNELGESDIVIICSSEKRQLQSILESIESEPILILSDSEGFAHAGTHINMYVENNYIRYEINQKAIETTGLKISSLLLASAKIIRTDD